MCEGPIEGILSNLLSSASSTLRSHLSTAIANCSRSSSTPSRPNEPSLSALHSLWSGTLPTHTILLTTLVVLEDALRKASQETSSNKALDDLAKEINTALKVITNLLQGRNLEEDGKNRDSKLSMVPSEGSQSFVGSSIAMKTSVASALGGTESSSEIGDDRGPSRGRDTGYQEVSSHQLSRLWRIGFALYSYKQKINQLRQLLESEPSVDLHRSLTWMTMLHFRWSAKKKACLVSAVGASLVNECGYSDVTRPFLSVAQSEKTVCSILQTVQAGSNVLLVGHTVSDMFDTISLLLPDRPL